MFTFCKLKLTNLDSLKLLIPYFYLTSNALIFSFHCNHHYILDEVQSCEVDSPWSWVNYCNRRERRWFTNSRHKEIIIPSLLGPTRLSSLAAKWGVMATTQSSGSSFIPNCSAIDWKVKPTITAVIGALSPLSLRYDAELRSRLPSCHRTGKWAVRKQTNRLEDLFVNKEDH